MTAHMEGGTPSLRTGPGRQIDTGASCERPCATLGKFDEGQCPTGRHIADEQMNALAVKRNPFHGEWNCSLANRG